MVISVFWRIVSNVDDSRYPSPWFDVLGPPSHVVCARPSLDLWHVASSRDLCFPLRGTHDLVLLVDAEILPV